MAKQAIKPPNELVTVPLPEVVPRPPSDEDWQVLHDFFPNLIRANVTVTGAATPVYNCIAWTLGITDRWINPPQPLQAFEELYEIAGYQARVAGSAYTVIDGWQNLSSVMTHGSRIAGELYPGLWESKLGRWLRITHGRQELRGDLYGEIVVSFAPESQALGRRRSMVRANASLTVFERHRLRSEVDGVNDVVRSAFERELRAWRATWDEDENAFVQDTRALAKGEAFGALVAMGRPIIPLVVEAMLEPPDGFVVLPLYDVLVLQYRPDLVLLRAPGEPKYLEGEQGRARDSAKLWLRR
jgi:hypothetical protein